MAPLPRTSQREAVEFAACYYARASKSQSMRWHRQPGFRPLRPLWRMCWDIHRHFGGSRKGTYTYGSRDERSGYS